MDRNPPHACLRAKRFRKPAARPFVPLRSAGLSSFVGGLRRVAQHERNEELLVGGQLPVEPESREAEGVDSDRRG